MKIAEQKQTDTHVYSNSIYKKKSTDPELVVNWMFKVAHIACKKQLYPRYNTIND